jgi:hypothetical protein
VSRVLAVVERSIMVHIHDVVPGDIISVRGDESDPIIQYIEQNGEDYRFHYRDRGPDAVKRSNWMQPWRGNGHNKVFVADLKGERHEYSPE